VLQGMLFGVERMVATDARGATDPRFAGVVATPPRVSAHRHRDGWVLLHWYTHHDREAVRALTRLDADGDRIARLSNYFYNPDLIHEVCAELGVLSRTNGYRWWPATP
jgi:RNA polymerase sigma-70 factor, ECF subfamily